MKNKFNFLVKLICLISIFISVSIFIVFVVSFESTKVKLASAGKVNINSDSQRGSINPTIYEVVLEDEEQKDMLVQSNQENTEEIIENTKSYSEIELNSENCECSVDEEKDTVNIDKYRGSVDCIVIPSEIDGKKVEKVNTEDFSDCYNLETIKISKEVSSQIEEIPNFEINEELEEENYVVYTTTREYGEAYKGYLKLSEEERSKVNIIPPKYEMPLEIYSQDDIKEFQPVGGVVDNSAYDLRNDIFVKVENQNPYGICYAFSSFTAAETFWALNNNETIDFSEVHAAILTTGNGGTTFVQDTEYYSNKLGPVYEKEYPIYGVRSATLTNASNIEACIESNTPSSYSSVQSAAKTEIPVKYITGTKQFPTVTQAIKQDSRYDEALAEVRVDIKEHIKTYGALAAVVDSNAIQEYNGKLVANDQTSSSVNHGVTVIGWDDNFNVSNFPSSCRPSENGAYLVLNSWGADWGENGCYWVSYEDKWIEYYLIGVTEMSEASENLKVSSMIVTDQETGNILDNGNIADGTKIKMEVDVEVTTPISGETIEVSLRDNIADYTSYMTVTGTNLINNKANIEMLLDTEEIRGDQYVLEINYGTETVSKMIETPKDFSYSVNADGTITMIAYTGSDKEVVIPAEYDGYTVSTIGKDTFMSCDVEKITIEKGITTIKDYAFRGCESLTEIILPRTLKTIGTAPFIACTNLQQLIIPRSVTTIGPGLVQYCTNLKELVIFKETTSIGSSMFYETPNATVYCESGSTALTYAQNRSYSYSIITNRYNITYNKNAGTDTVTNMPSTQSKVKYDTISMSSNIPVRSGYKFLGWAASSSATEAKYQPGDDYRTDANLSLYAVWEATEREISYKVEYYKDGLKSNVDTITETVPATQTTITVDKTKINTENKYLGYSFEKTEPAVLPNTVSNGDVIKVYYNVINYTITYDLAGGNIDSGSNPGTYTVNDTFTLNNPKKEGHTFIGWTGSNGNTPKTSLTIEPGTTGNKTYKANYSINTYTVTYKVDGEIYGEVENYTYGQTITPREVPSKTGYKFSGWSEIPTKMPANNVEITGTFTIDNTQTKTLSYTVEYYKDNIKQDSDTEKEEITVQILELDEITVDKAKINIENKYLGYSFEKTVPAVIPNSVQNGDIIKVYYKLTDYTITYDLDGGNLVAVNNPDTYTINDTFTLNNPEKEGHTFIGWTGSNGNTLETSVTIEPGTTGNKTYKANYSINTYTVTYKVDGEIYGEIESYTYGQTITPRDVPSKTGYKFSGWSEIPAKMPANNLEITGTFAIDNTQAKELSYTVEYYKDGVKQEDDTKTEKTAVQILEPDEITVDKTKINTENKYVGYNFEKTVPAVIPEKVTTGTVIKVYYTVQNYTISYDLNGGMLPVGKSNPESYTVNDYFVLENPEKEGYIFIGWTGSNGETPEDTITIEKGTIGNKTYKANFTLDTYTIAYDLDGGILAAGNNPETYTINDTFTLNTPEKEGHTFIGWTGSNGNTPEILVTIEPGTTGNKEYKANYTINSYTVTYKVDGEIYGEVENYEYGKRITPRGEPSKVGYKFSGWSEIPETMPANNLEITGIFIIDDTQVKELSYTVEYYKDDVKQDDDTKTEKIAVQILEPDEITVDKTKINTENKYVGYNFEKTEPAVIPEKVTTGTVIKVYYTVQNYMISYDLDDGNLANDKTNPVTYTVNESFTLNNPEKLGYTFIGWTGSNGETPEKTITIEKGTIGNKTYKANFTLDTYTITYDLDSGILPNGKTNPETFTVNDTFVLNTPEKEGHTFIGWTGSNGNSPEASVTIESGTTGNKTYKANFDINTYTITYKVDGEIYGEVENYEYGKRITPREEPSKVGYKFSGWGQIPETMPARNIELSGMFYLDGTQVKELSYTVEYYKDNVKQNTDTETGKSIVQVLESDEIAVDKSKINTENKYVGYNFEKTEPATIPEKVTTGTVIKVYYTVQNYTISYDLNGGTLPVEKTNPESYTVNDSFVLKAPEKEGYTFIGWTGSNGNSPETSVTIEKGTIGNKEYKANYSINYYWLDITYFHPDIKKYGPLSYHEKYAYGENYYVESMIVPGYTPSISVIEGIMGAKNLSYSVEYTPNTNTKYIVEHYKQNVLDNKYTLVETEEGFGTTDTLTTAIAKEYLGFTAKIITQENINGDESTIVKIYYDRNLYTVNYYARLSETEEYIWVDSVEYRFEETVTPLDYPESYGRIFDGWSEIPETMPANDAYIYGTFSIDDSQRKELKYTVEYYKNGIKQNSDTEVEKTTVQVLEPDEITVNKSKINLENKYVGYEFYITNFSSIPEKVASGAVIKIYYIPIVYTITYDLDGGSLTESNSETYTIEDEVKLNNPKKVGHTFIGWTGSNGETPEQNITINKGTIGNKEYKANYSINTYTLKYIVDGEQYGEVDNYEYNQEITPREEPTRRGYIFSGWSEIPGTMPANDVEVTGTFTIDESQAKVLSYTVEYYKNGVKQDSDTEIEEIKVLEFESDEMSVNSEKINRENKYIGYTFEKTEPAEIPEKVMTGDVIKVYYTANTDTKYLVEHYKQNILDNNYTLTDTEEGFGTTDTLTAAGAKEYLGFTLKELTQVNIDGNGNTVVRIYYDRNVYLLTYIVDGEVDGEPEEYRFEEAIALKENPSKLGYKFSGWSEVPEIMPANNIETSGTFIFDEAQTKTLSYTVEYYKDNIKQDADTETEEVTVHVLESDEMTVNKEKINIENKYVGCILDSILTQIPDKVTNGDIIKIYYNRKDARINVEYRDFVTGEEISEKVIKSAKVFDTYDISEDRKEIEGYTFIEGPELLTGEYTEEEQTKVYKYAKNSKVTVNYIEKSTGEIIAESVVIDGYETKDYVSEEKTIENYVLIETSNNTSGKMTREEIVVNYYYIYVSEGVIERHLDVITNEVLDTELYEGNEGDSYKTEPKEIEGYDLIEERMPTNSEGTMTKEAIIVEYFYIRNTSVKVQHVDKITNEVLDEEVIYGNQNDTYETQAKEIEGYRLMETPINAAGTMIVTKDENQNVITETIVIYYYKKVSEGVIERHVDIKTDEILEENVHSGLEGDSYKIDAKEFEGYDIVEERIPTNAEGTMTKEKIEVNYYYIRKTTVIAQYIDVITNEKILEDVVINNHEGDQYKTERKEIEGYDIVEERLPENEEGTTIVTKDENDDMITEIVVKYYYARKTTVKVEYIDKETGEKISEDTIIEGNEGEAYKAEPKEVEGYNLLEEREKTEGTMTKEEIIAKFYYKKKLDSEEYLIKEDGIKKIVVGTTISDLKDNLSIQENYVILDQDGNEVSETEVIKTGMKLKLEDGKEYDLIVRGDLNCDGKVTLTDLSKLILHYNGNRGFILSGSPCDAADMNFDDKITLTDVSQMVVFYNSI